MMGVPYIIRAATEDDSADILNVYSFYIENTAASFETSVPSVEEFAQRIGGILKTYPYLVCELDHEIIGFTYASRHRERAGYRFGVDVSIYIKKGMQGQGIGTALYERLFAELSDKNYYNAYASITLPNESSCALHKKFGFKEIGIHHNTGYKLGKWHDILWLDKVIKDHSILPE